MQNVEEESMAGLTKFAKGPNKEKVKYNRFRSIYIDMMPQGKSHAAHHPNCSSSSSGEETVEGSENFSKILKKIDEDGSEEDYELN